MTRQEKIKIRAERVQKRRERILKRQEAELIAKGVDPSTITTTTTTAAPTTTTTTSAIIPDDVKLSLEICIHTFRYQKRLCWMLSSILQQKGDIPNIIVNISHCSDDGNPTTEEVCKFFREKGLNIVETIVTKEEVCNRAIARNKQATATKADWVLFADSDMVYSEFFFDDLQKQLRRDLRDVQLVMGADRTSLDEKFSIKFFEEDKGVYPRVIESPSDIASKWPVKWKTGRGTAPGNFQLVNGNVLRGKAKGKITDMPKDFWRNTRGDRALRVRLGGRKAIEAKNQYHLNHDRGGPEIQR